jgi:hypothetical protein
MFVPNLIKFISGDVGTALWCGVQAGWIVEVLKISGVSFFSR